MKDVAELLDRALEHAFINQFGLLFGVLSQVPADDFEQGLERFARGLQKLLDTSTHVAAIIHSAEDET